MPKPESVTLSPDLKLSYSVFSDGFTTETLVDAIYNPSSGHSLICARKRACPPEDCGGVWGYADFLKVIRNPRHPEHEERLEWTGGSFDPEHFSLEEANRHMHRMLRLAK